MTGITIDESGMTFGPFEPAQCFPVETSEAYAVIQNGVKIAEFVLLRDATDGPPTVWVVEAKSSSPRPDTTDTFQDFIEDIRSKLVNAFSLVLACCMGRHPKSAQELPQQFSSLDWARCGVRFVLVINGHREEWLPPLHDALHEALRPTIKTWALGANAVVVLNETLAVQHGLVMAGSNSAA